LTWRVPPGVAFALCALIWSGSWLAIKTGLSDAPPLGTAALRAACAAALLAAIALVARVPRPDRRAVSRALLAGTVFIGANFALVYWSAPRLPTGVASLLYASAPLQAALLVPLAGDEPLRRAHVAGAAIGMLGIAMAFGGAGLRGAAALPVAAVVLAATASAGGTALSRRCAALHPLWLNAIANGAGAVLLGLLAITTEARSPVPATPVAWAAFLYMLLAGSVAGFLLYFGLLRAWGSARATYVTLLTPLGAIALGAAFAGEALTAGAVGGAMLVALGGAVSAGGGRARRPSR
jgi:drug/metabolite transporter (DMT)-like permease